ncbi:MAG TPA: hypothetical protein VFW04_12260 [Gemmatimonadaceae bacterium]|nr:hypothetical protein [Gemmatimonadaceae bacterium]
MGRSERIALIQQIEQERKSKVVAYITGDRGQAGAQIGDDALRPLYDHLREIGHIEKLDLFIYSRGGATDVPWRIVSALRAASDEWSVLIPFRANSAATMIALGADHIVLGLHGELGPIDPSLTTQRIIPQPGGGQGMVIQDTVSVEDVMAYVRFVQQRVGLSDQGPLAESLGKLTERLDAVMLGNIYRTHSHIRDVARRIIASRREPPDAASVDGIVSTLAEKVYAHGHAIGLKDAEQLRLPVKQAPTSLDTLMWDLLGQYEQDMKLLEPVDPAAAVAISDPYLEPCVISIMESARTVHEFTGTLEVRGKRQMPPNLTVALNIALQVPPGVNFAQLPPQAQQLLQLLQQMIGQAQQAATQHAAQAVADALKTQAPLLGTEVAFRNGVWKRSS